MYFQFLVEDASSADLIDVLMKNHVPHADDVSYNIKRFHGIGGFRKKRTPKEIKTGKLLNDLEIYLPGFDKSLRGIRAALFVVLDNDDKDTLVFHRELETLAQKKNISMDYVFCIAVEEVEAWLLGDREALLQAYPSANRRNLSAYRQDSICGTWECLAEVVQPGWLKKARKEKMPYSEIGTEKSRWAKEIGAHMCPKNNISPSFQSFWREVQSRISAV